MPDFIMITAQARGAWPNGSVIVKTNGQPGDATPDGTLGTVLGSLDVSEAFGPARFAYCVAWANRPDLPCFVADTNNDGSPRVELKP